MTKYSFDEVPEYVVHEVNIIHRATGAVVARIHLTEREYPNVTRISTAATNYR